MSFSFSPSISYKTQYTMDLENVENIEKIENSEVESSASFYVEEKKEFDFQEVKLNEEIMRSYGVEDKKTSQNEIKDVLNLFEKSTYCSSTSNENSPNSPNSPVLVRFTLKTPETLDELFKDLEDESTGCEDIFDLIKRNSSHYCSVQNKRQNPLRQSVNFTSNLNIARPIPIKKC